MVEWVTWVFITPFEQWLQVGFQPVLWRKSGLEANIKQFMKHFLSGSIFKSFVWNKEKRFTKLCTINSSRNFVIGYITIQIY